MCLQILLLTSLLSEVPACAPTVGLGTLGEPALSACDRGRPARGQAGIPQSVLSVLQASVLISQTRLCLPCPLLFLLLCPFLPPPLTLSAHSLCSSYSTSFCLVSLPPVNLPCLHKAIFSSLPWLHQPFTHAPVIVTPECLLDHKFHEGRTLHLHCYILSTWQKIFT